MPLADLRKRLAVEDKTFVWIKRQVDEPVAKEIAALGIKGFHQRREYKRQYPEGEAAAHVVGFTNVEDRGQEGVELAFNQQLSGKNGSRRVIKDRLGRVVEDVRDVVPPVDGPDLQLSIDSKVQYFAYQKLKEAVQTHKARAGSVVVLDTQTGEVLALANYPSYNPNRRVNLSGEQLRNRVLTDSFEPGSTMKPFIITLALDKGMVTPNTPINTAPGRITIGGSTISDSHPHDVLTVDAGDPEIEQRRHGQDGHADAARAKCGKPMPRPASGRSRRCRFPGAVTGRLRPYKTWRPIEQATMSYGYGLSASLFQLAQAYTIFARDGELIPVTLQKSRRAGQRRARVQREERGRGAHDAADWPPAPAAPARARRPWATRWAASPAPRASRKARATPTRSTAASLWGWRRWNRRASWWR